MIQHRNTQTRRTRRLAILVPVFLQLILIGGFISFLILSQETLQQNQTGTDFNCFSNVGLSPAGEKVFKSLNKMHLIPIYKKAAAENNIPWEYLVGINYVESTLGTNKSASNVGAIGPMQFMERTWVGWSEQFAVDYPNARTQHWGKGDINDIYLNEIKKPEVIKRYGGLGRDGDGDGIADPLNEVDAIFSAANYLARNGMAEGKIDKAIFAYNHSMDYVNLVKSKANEFTQPVSADMQQDHLSSSNEDNSQNLDSDKDNTNNSQDQDVDKDNTNNSQDQESDEDNTKNSQDINNQSESETVNHPLVIGDCGSQMVDNSPGWGWPLPKTVNVRISNGWGAVEAFRNYVPHSGTDFAAPNINGDPIVATKSGTIVSVGYLGNCGNHVTIDHGNGVTSVYCHFSNNQPLVKVGQQVKKGQLVGYVGTTGRSTGPHLHYGIKVNGRFVNPLNYIDLKSMK